MELASSIVFMVEQAPQNSCHHGLCPQDELHLPPAFPRGFLRSAGRSDPGYFHITAFVLDLGACEILCASFKNGVSISYRPLALPKSTPHWPSKPNILGSFLPSAEPLGWGAQCGAQTPCSLGRTCAVIIILPFVGCPPPGMGLDFTISPSPTHLAVLPSLYL